MTSENQRYKVVQTEHLDEQAAAWLAERVQLVRSPLGDSASLDNELQDADGLLVRTYTEVNEELLAKAPKLKVIGRAGVGLDNFDLSACSQRGVTVVHTPDANTQAVVEYAWSLLLENLRPRRYLTPEDTAEDFYHYRKTLVGSQINEMTLGILGMGRIGRRMAEVAHILGLRVLHNDLLDDDALQLPVSCASQAVDKATLWRESDLLTIHIDGRAENHFLLDDSVLSQLQSHCTVLNTARGMLIDPEALARWSERAEPNGGQAILDVHFPEPPPADYPLWGRPNVKMLPHLASRTSRAMANMSSVVHDVWRVLQGQPPQWPAPLTP